MQNAGIYDIMHVKDFFFVFENSDNYVGILIICLLVKKKKITVYQIS